jgi:hypothetical protein
MKLGRTRQRRVDRLKTSIGFMNEEAEKFLFGLIDLEEWDAAKWRLTGFAVPVGTPLPPWLMIVFIHEQPARALFAGLRSKVGQEDGDELIRVSIVEGTFHGNPYSYAVNIGPNVPNVMKHFQVELPERGYVDFVALCRVNRVNPSRPSQNLAQFKEQFGKTGSYLLIPGCYRRKGSLWPIDDLRILKRSINFRRKEEILPGDPDRAVL